jgi:asparaginyl-tRNA synthetase
VLDLEIRPDASYNADMSTTTTIDHLSNHVGQHVAITGWLYNSRSSGKIAFLIVRDGTGQCQCIVEKSSVPEDVFERVKGLTQEASVRVEGLVKEEPRAPGGYEMHAVNVEPIAPSVDYPITPKPHGIDFLMRNRHLHLRSKRPWALMRIRHTIIDAVRTFFDSRGFVLIDTPILTPSAGEGASTLFEVDYFGEPVYLAQTGQLYLESAAMAHRKVYCFGPTFRAEKSKTRRHLTEFWMVEPEVAFITLEELMALAEDFVSSIVERVLTDRREELKTLERDTAPLESLLRPFARLSYSQAVDLLRGPTAQDFLQGEMERLQTRINEMQATIAKLDADLAASRKPAQQDMLTRQIQEVRDEVADVQEQLQHIPEHRKIVQEFRWGDDLGGADETVISRTHDRPVFVHHYPREAKAFYMKLESEDQGKTVRNFDLLAPEGYGEIIGGSMREDDYDTLVMRIKEMGMDPEHYAWYLDLRKYGSVPHGGFGLGIERTVAWICGLKHIRETIPFPRMLGKVYP